MLKRCAFSGHRPLYFPWKENESDPACVRLKAALEEEIAGKEQEKQDMLEDKLTTKEYDDPFKGSR